ncbi:isocitrate lyase [Kwoniella bestiolae CBS 10118]|uniref:Isocitrate lyase n=1 Tax=Kwoniella bestiolae CBS 10118 TaxID=1296100 RepID=A0A1B9FR15_9TREE|nr:isocitrate lyase [Kwoniella bestiolae CBS 10118]OCF21214.1 isocitrate lyase [Kwoniella bestiolae CBS 10118]
MSTEDWLNPSSIEEWWSSPSQQGIKRPYSADTVASLRDVFPENHHSNAMALKLRGIFERVQKDRSVNLTTSVIDPVTAQVMAEAGFETLYVSGGMSANTDTATDDPGPDLADYTYDTVPKKVSTIYRSQLLHSRTARVNQSGKEDIPLLPIIADADSGHGQHTAIMKLVKLFVQSGVSGFHLDDLVSGVKRHDGKDGLSSVLVPTNEYLRRLVAAKLQLDIMGSEVVSIARTDAETATHITSTIDHRDRPFILGATVPLPRHFIHTEGNSAREEWKREAKLSTLDEAFQKSHPDLYDQFISQTQKMNVAEALSVAHRLVPAFYWNYENPRTSEGWYAFKGGIEAALSRANAAANISDAVWACAHKYKADEAQRFATGVQEVHPGKWMAYNITGGFPEDGSADEEVKKIPSYLASIGYVWQFLPIAGLTAVGHGSQRAMKAIKEDGLYGYLSKVSRPAARHADGTSPEWWWKIMGKLADDAADAIGEGL